MNEKNKEVIINALTHSFQFVMGVILDDQARLASYEAVPAYMLFWLCKTDKECWLSCEASDSSVGETTDTLHFIGAVKMDEICEADCREEHTAFETELKSLLESILFPN